MFLLKSKFGNYSFSSCIFHEFLRKLAISRPLSVSDLEGTFYFYKAFKDYGGHHNKIINRKQ